MTGNTAAGPKADKLPAVKLCDLFLDYSQKHHAADTFALYKFFLASFCKKHGRLPAKTVVPFHVNSGIDSKPTWKGSRRHAALAVKRAFAWADEQGLLSPSPLKGLDVEPGNRRTRVLTRAEQAEILAAIKDQSFREFVAAMLATGCRPSEVARVTAAAVNLELGAWVLAEHKTRKKTGKPRVIYLSPEMLALTRRLMAAFPEGPLFRGPRVKKPNTRNGIRCQGKRTHLLRNSRSTSSRKESSHPALSRLFLMPMSASAFFNMANAIFRTSDMFSGAWPSRSR